MNRHSQTYPHPTSSARARWALVLLLILAACANEPSDEPDTTALAEVTDTPRSPDVVDLQNETAPDLADLVEIGPDLEDLVDLAQTETVNDVDPDTTDIPSEATVEIIQEVTQELVPQPCEEGEGCDDLDPCTMDDFCADGFCTGIAYECDDERPCSLDTCDGLGNCQYTLMVGRCLINGVCAKTGDKKPNNQCLFCDPLANPYKWVEEPFAPCDDGSACTVNDQCLNAICKGELSLCDDQNPCTFDVCDEDEGCAHPEANIPCDDGDPCTALDFCENGECKGGFAPPCNDDNPCTADTCQAGKGCFHTMLDGKQCDDGNACTTGDVCLAGECVPGQQVVTCNDFNDCTSDICDLDVGCVYPLAGNPCCINDINICDDGDPCTLDDCDVDTGACLYFPNDGPCTDKDACTINDLCAEGVCQGEIADCDDQNPCTLDFCLKLQGCIHESLNLECDDDSVCTLNDQCTNGVCTGTSLNCNDYNLCTDDSCDPDLGCLNNFNQAPCNDLDLCTGNDHCVDGECHGDAKACDDGNPCTKDQCDPGAGCQNLFTTTACDDGDPCTEDDMCEAGVCKPGTAVCVSCDYEFSDAVNRITEMEISKDKKAGNALDLNGDGTPDNSMSGIGGLANDSLQGSLDKGDINLLFEHHGIKTNGAVYELAVFLGDLAPGFEQCDFAGAYCGYAVKEDSLDPDSCQAVVLFDNASIFQGKLVAGGPAFTFPWQIPFSEQTTLNITLFSATLHADVTVKQGLVTSLSGILGGAIPKESFLAAIEAVPAEQLPLPKDMVVQLIEALVKNDIDTDGDGAHDAASIAIRFEGIAGGIIGIE